MKNFLILAACSCLLLTSCVTSKKYAELESKQKSTQDLLNTATVKLNDCLSEKSGLSAENSTLKNQVSSLNATNGDLIKQIGDFTDLTIKGAENLEKSLESMKEKDVTINKLRDAITRRDSVIILIYSIFMTISYIVPINLYILQLTCLILLLRLGIIKYYPQNYRIKIYWIFFPNLKIML